MYEVNLPDMAFVSDDYIPPPEVLKKRHLVEVPCLHDDILWLRLLESARQLDELNAEITVVCNAGEKQPVEGEFARSLAQKPVVCAHFHGTWYRASVQSCSPVRQPNHAQVLFVDYGNIATVDISQLQPCRLEWCLLERQAVPVRLSAMAESSYAGYVTYLRKCTGQPVGLQFEAGFEYKLKEKFYTFDMYSAQLIAVGASKSISECALEENFRPLSYTTVPVDQILDVLPLLSDGEWMPKQPVFSADVVVASSDGPHQFCLQLKSQAPNIELVQANVQAHCDSSCEMMHPPWAGQALCARYTVDNQWYRATCVEVIRPIACSESDEMYAVEFVDYGNRETVGIRDLKPITSELVSMHSLMLPSSLYLVSRNSQDQQLPEVCKKFTEDVLGKTLSCGFYRRLRGAHGSWHYDVDLGDGISDSLLKFSIDAHARLAADKAELEKKRRLEVVKVSEPGNIQLTVQDSVPENLLLKKPCFKAKLNVVDAEEVCILDVLANGTLVCQLRSSYAELNKLEERLTETLSHERLGRPMMQVGAACAVRYNQDRHWYRGIIQRQNVEFIAVAFADYGNVQKCDHVRKLAVLPAFALTLPCQIFHCRLSGIEICTGGSSEQACWSEKQVSDLRSTLDGVVARVTFLSVEDHVWSVHLSHVNNQTGGRSELAKYLVTKGYAQPVEASQPGQVPLPPRSFCFSSSSDSLSAKAVPMRSSKRPDSVVVKTNGCAASPVPSPGSAVAAASPTPTPKQAGNGGSLAPVKFITADVAGATFAVGDCVDVVISHVTSDNTFWCQIQRDAEIETMSRKLQEVGAKWMAKFKAKSTGIKRPEGLCVAALYNVDELWYRARILSTVGTGSFLVLFVDFGNQSEVLSNDIFPLSAEMRKTSALAFLCRLPSTVSLNMDTLYGLCEEGTLLTCTVLAEKVDGIWTVELKQDGILLGEERHQLPKHSGNRVIAVPACNFPPVSCSADQLKAAYTEPASVTSVAVCECNGQKTQCAADRGTGSNATVTAPTSLALTANGRVSAHPVDTETITKCDSSASIPFEPLSYGDPSFVPALNTSAIVKVMFLESVENFWCQACSSVTHELDTSLRVLYKEKEEKKDVVSMCLDLLPGTSVIVQHRGGFYRGVLTSSPACGVLDVFLPDSGRTGTARCADIFTLPNFLSFSELPCQTFHCRLKEEQGNSVPAVDICSTNHFRVLTKGPLTCSLSGRDANGTWYVHLQTTLFNSVLVLLRNSIAALGSPTGGLKPIHSGASYNMCFIAQGNQHMAATVCVARQPSQFTLQLHRDQTLLAELEKDMASFYSQLASEISRLQSALVSDLCVVQVDGKWYRGQVYGAVLETASQPAGTQPTPGVDKRQVEVLLVDYGNIITVPFQALHHLHQPFFPLPAQALLCSLSCPDLNLNDKDILLFFHNYVNQCTEVSCMFKSFDPCCTPLQVDLFRHGHSLCSDLLHRFPQKVMKLMQPPPLSGANVLVCAQQLLSISTKPNGANGNGRLHGISDHPPCKHHYDLASKSTTEEGISVAEDQCSEDDNLNQPDPQPIAASVLHKMYQAESKSSPPASTGEGILAAELKLSALSPAKDILESASNLEQNEKKGNCGHQHHSIHPTAITGLSMLLRSQQRFTPGITPRFGSMFGILPAAPHSPPVADSPSPEAADDSVERHDKLSHRGSVELSISDTPFISPNDGIDVHDPIFCSPDELDLNCDSYRHVIGCNSTSDIFNDDPFPLPPSSSVYCTSGLGKGGSVSGEESDTPTEGDSAIGHCRDSSPKLSSDGLPLSRCFSTSTPCWGATEASPPSSPIEASPVSTDQPACDATRENAGGSAQSTVHEYVGLGVDLLSLDSPSNGNRKCCDSCSDLPNPINPSLTQPGDAQSLHLATERSHIEHPVASPPHVSDSTGLTTLLDAVQPSSPVLQRTLILDLPNADDCSAVAAGLHDRSVDSTFAHSDVTVLFQGRASSLLGNPIVSEALSSAEDLRVGNGLLDCQVASCVSSPAGPGSDTVFDCDTSDVGSTSAKPVSEAGVGANTNVLASVELLLDNMLAGIESRVSQQVEAMLSPLQCKLGSPASLHCSEGGNDSIVSSPLLDEDGQDLLQFSD